MQQRNPRKPQKRRGSSSSSQEKGTTSEMNQSTKDSMKLFEGKTDFYQGLQVEGSTFPLDSETFSQRFSSNYSKIKFCAPQKLISMT